jgi:ketosteroid isomerase-like protein
MKTSQALVAIVGTVIFATSGIILAQDTPDDAAVWSVIERQWEASQQGDSKWVEALVAEDFTGWSNGTPAPRTKESVRMWQKFDAKQWDGKMHELYPLSIVVHDDVAIAHYLYSNAGENAEGKTEVIHGRFTDVLVRIEGEWKFIAWHGGADGDNN